MTRDKNEIEESVIGFEALYTSMYRCRKGVGWKDSTAHYVLNGIEETLKLERQLHDGSYKPRPQKKIHITHPKERDAVSIAFRDRVYQRSLNDNQIYPAMARTFIKHNAACQKGKGTDFARDVLDEFLRSYYRKYGTDGYVLQCDIKGYYPNMDHAVAEECFRKQLDPVIFKQAQAIMREQYEGKVGYNPGSQMIQIAGISVLSGFDHMMKEQQRLEWYMRYMDDFPIIHPDRGYLVECRDEIERYLKEMNMQLNQKKTRIYPLKNGVKILGFTHRLTDTGKVIRIIDPKNVKEERKRLRRLVHLAKQGKRTREKCDECFEGWKAHARHGNSHMLIKSMEQYYSDLWEEEIAWN